MEEKYSITKLYAHSLIYSISGKAFSVTAAKALKSEHLPDVSALSPVKPIVLAE